MSKCSSCLKNNPFTKFYNNITGIYYFIKLIITIAKN